MSRCCFWKLKLARYWGWNQKPDLHQSPKYWFSVGVCRNSSKVSSGQWAQIEFDLRFWSCVACRFTRLMLLTKESRYSICCEILKELSGIAAQRVKIPYCWIRNSRNLPYQKNGAYVLTTLCLTLIKDGNMSKDSSLRSIRRPMANTLMLN